MSSDPVCEVFATLFPPVQCTAYADPTRPFSTPLILTNIFKHWYIPKTYWFLYNAS